MKNFMFNSNAKKKISITSALFSLLILFFALNCSFCSNFCRAESSGTDDGIFNNSEASRSEEDKNENNSEEEEKKDDETKKNNEEEDENESTEAPESKRGDLCPKCILL